jgi:hypothetical protein
VTRDLRADSPIRDRRIGDVNRRYEAYLARGFPTAPFDGEPEPERLQCRNELDRTNWLGLVVDCQFKIAFDLGDVTEAGTALRCTSNRMYQVSPNDALGRMITLLGQVQAAQANWWRLKDLCRTVRFATDLEALDLEEGWP